MAQLVVAHPLQVIASVYGPISYPPLPLLVFRQTEGGSLELVASGEQLHGCLRCLCVDGHGVIVWQRLQRWPSGSGDEC